jgi:putative transcriptional regulator
LSQHFDLPESDDLIYYGGPVEPAALLVLHNASELSNGDPEVSDGVYIGSSSEAFEEVVRRIGESDESLQFRIYAGCAGWSPGQLEGEISRGDWYTLPAPSHLPYDHDPYAMYPTLLQQLFEEHRLLPHNVKNPDLN